jgi:hypothetical protein
MHQHSVEPSETGSVVLDIGGDTGALIIYTGPDLLGVEIEVSPAEHGTGGLRTHSAVRLRQVQGAVFHSAVYPGLPAGTYTVWATGDAPVGSVTIVGGTVGEFAWPDNVPFRRPPG